MGDTAAEGSGGESSVGGTERPSDQLHPSLYAYLETPQAKRYAEERKNKTRFNKRDFSLFSM